MDDRVGGSDPPFGGSGDESSSERLPAQNGGEEADPAGGAVHGPAASSCGGEVAADEGEAVGARGAATRSAALRTRWYDCAATAARKFWWDVLSHWIGGAASCDSGSIRSKHMTMRVAAVRDVYFILVDSCWDSKRRVL